MATFTFLIGIDFGGLALGLLVFTIPGFFFARFLLWKKTGRPTILRTILIGFLLSPILLVLFGLLFFLATELQEP